MNTPSHRPVASLLKRLLCAGALAAGTLSAAYAQKPEQVTPPPHDGPLRALTPSIAASIIAACRCLLLAAPVPSTPVTSPNCSTVRW